MCRLSTESARSSPAKSNSLRKALTVYMDAIDDADTLSAVISELVQILHVSVGLNSLSGVAGKTCCASTARR